ncbi:hypothetical protein PFISCL1PPCAC_28782, partial [Pristionchus fissidentatus]
ETLDVLVRQNQEFRLLASHYRKAEMIAVNFDKASWMLQEVLEGGVHSKIALSESRALLCEVHGKAENESNPINALMYLFFELTARTFQYLHCESAQTVMVMDEK